VVICYFVLYNESRLDRWLKAGRIGQERPDGAFCWSDAASTFVKVGCVLTQNSTCDNPAVTGARDAPLY